MPLRHVRKFVEALGAEPAGAPADAGVRPARAGHRRAAAQGRRRAPRLPHRRRARLPRRSTAARRRSPSGEGQRIRLATQIGAALVGVLYVLDEPSVGLHARDNARLIEAQAPPARPRQHASSSSSTTARRSSPPITSSTWARARACTAARSSRRVRRREIMANPKSHHRPVAHRQDGSSPSPPSARARTKAQRPRRRRARAQPAQT